MEILFVAWLIFAILGMWIANQKHREGGEGFILGLLFGPIGCLIEAILPNGTQPAKREYSALAVEKAREEARAHAQRITAENAQRAAIRDEADRRVKAEAEAARVARVARVSARNKAYRAMGIEPGPFAWFKALPDVVQALTIGLVLAIPASAFLLVAIGS